ncbi:MAG: hypothetical protein MI757_06055 [Pirellulales bacterium]|nr:hypothetical protein [Pirellulales bacterium]
MLDDLLFGNESNAGAQLSLRVSSHLPSEASREIAVDGATDVGTVDVVLNSEIVEQVLAHLDEQGHQVVPEENLALCWPILRRLISQLGLSSRPRDRFLERIDTLSRMSVVSANVLYDDVAKGMLVPNHIGEINEHFVCKARSIEPENLYLEHPYFRMLNELGRILLDETLYRENQSLVYVMAREYLDDRYLRLSISGVMPRVTDAMAPMPFRDTGSHISTPYPRQGRYGILEHEDLFAWKLVEGPFRDMGFILLRQLGMGEFGRVYEALNTANPTMPNRVALKVDRLIGGSKNAIAEADIAMQIGRDLARSPHIIRVYDAGILDRRQLTYHVLQVVDGDTLDNLAGLTGKEHSSITRHVAGRSEAAVRSEHDKSVELSKGEGWRRRQITKPFTESLSLSQHMDLQTSIFLWLEEVHRLGYVVNDLKNGNLMVSRRGQLKGIDLDAYSLLRSPIDSLTDFLFLSTSALLFVLHLAGKRDQTSVTAEQMFGSQKDLREGIRHYWPFEDVSVTSHGRVETADVIELLSEILYRCRTRRYVDSPDDFSSDIDRWIQLKHDVFDEEIVLD